MQGFGEAHWPLQRHMPLGFSVLVARSSVLPVTLFDVNQKERCTCGMWHPKNNSNTIETAFRISKTWVLPVTANLVSLASTKYACIGMYEAVLTKDSIGRKYLQSWGELDLCLSFHIRVHNSLCCSSRLRTSLMLMFKFQLVHGSWSSALATLAASKNVSRGSCRSEVMTCLDPSNVISSW